MTTIIEQDTDTRYAFSSRPTNDKLTVPAEVLEIVTSHVFSAMQQAAQSIGDLSLDDSYVIEQIVEDKARDAYRKNSLDLDSMEITMTCEEPVAPLHSVQVVSEEVGPYRAYRQFPATVLDNPVWMELDDAMAAFAQLSESKVDYDPEAEAIWFYSGPRRGEYCPLAVIHGVSVSVDDETLQLFMVDNDTQWTEVAPPSDSMLDDPDAIAFLAQATVDAEIADREEKIRLQIGMATSALHEAELLLLSRCSDAEIAAACDITQVVYTVNACRLRAIKMVLMQVDALADMPI